MKNISVFLVQDAKELNTELERKFANEVGFEVVGTATDGISAISMIADLKPNLLICCIVRGKKIITPSGKDTMELNDTVIVVTTNKGLQDISDILQD